MSLRSIVATLAVVITQIAVFLYGWHFLVEAARSSGRFPRELAFGITLYYGTFIVLTTFVVCSLVTAITRRRRWYWRAILIGLALWLLWLWPSFDTRPIAGPSFFVLGAIVLILGSAMILPRIVTGQVNSAHSTSNTIEPETKLE